MPNAVHWSRNMSGTPSLPAGTHSPTWLFESIYEAEGVPALYPYAQLRNILSPQDIRPAVLDECGPLEAEFGRAAIDPFYRLLWLMNTTPAMFTTHTNVAPSHLKPPFEWARTQVAAQIIAHSRNPAAHDSRPATTALTAWLGGLIAKGAPASDTRGWMISVGLTPMTLIRLRHVDAPYPYRDEDLIHAPGFGCVVRIRGCANSRSKAAERWRAAAAFIADLIGQAQQQGRLDRAEPHRHIDEPPEVL
jgi:hypothetical protein